MSSTKFHLSLNVHDLPRMAAFLELLLGTKPALLASDYAKFELLDPPLVLSLIPSDIPQGTGLNHLGFRLPNRRTLSDLQQRLASAGIAYESEESVVCCHSQQSKFWVHDPAGNLWEMYILEEPGESGCDVVAITSRAPKVALEAIVKKTWSHRLGTPIPDSIPADDGSLDEVVLEGTGNAKAGEQQLACVVGEAACVLRVGGTLVLHGLTADRPLEHSPQLPGPAAAVERVPTAQELLAAVQHAGFIGLELETFGETYRFSHAGAELRETRLRAWRPSRTIDSLTRQVIYRGPFAEIRDDSGLIFLRGERTSVDDATWARLKASNAAAQFVFEGD